MKKKDGARYKVSKSRKRKFGETKPNFNAFVKQEKDDFINKSGAILKETNPPLYYSMINKPLPKKYLRKNYPIAPVNAYVPPQSKLSPEELDKQLEQEALERKKREEALREKQQKEMKEKERKERNRAAVAKEQRYIYWCDANEQGNYVSIHSDKFKNRGKKYEYY